VIIVSTQDGTCFKYEGRIEIYIDEVFLNINWHTDTPSKEEDDLMIWSSDGFDKFFIEDVKAIIGLSGPLYPIYPSRCGIITNIGE